MKVSVLSVGGKFGGGVSHAINSVKAMKVVGIEAELVTPNTIGEPDILFMDSIGMIGEKDTKANEKRLEKIMKYWGSVPFVTVRHGVTESRIFKHSFEFFKDMVWDLIISAENSKDMFELIAEEHKFHRLRFVERPFDFKDEYFRDKSAVEKLILSPARFAGCKHNDLILDIAKLLFTEKMFLMAGYEQGISWYRSIREHPNREYASFIGGYEDYSCPFSRCAFGIDLSYIHRGKFVNREAKQYVQIETIACGCIPIVFDIWQEKTGFKAVWLPSPKKEGRSIIFDVEKYAEIIRDFKYDFGMAVENRELLKKELDMEKIGNQYKDEFNKLLGRRSR